MKVLEIQRAELNVLQLLRGTAWFKASAAVKTLSVAGCLYTQDQSFEDNIS
jgi:hypothetical protein